jgi:hypothetical protein
MWLWEQVYCNSQSFFSSFLAILGQVWDADEKLMGHFGLLISASKTPTYLTPLAVFSTVSFYEGPLPVAWSLEASNPR